MKLKLLPAILEKLRRREDIIHRVSVAQPPQIVPSRIFKSPFAKYVIKGIQEK